jgi:integrase/recombinase XerD
MLSTLFPRAHARYTNVPTLGSCLEGLCTWLEDRGYPRWSIQQRMRAAASLADALHRDGVRSLGELTAASLRSYAPPPRKSGSPARGALVRSLAQYLEERGELAPSQLTPVQRRVADYVRYLDRVRGLSAGTITMHAATVTKFLLFIDYDACQRGLHQLRGTDVEAFVVKTGERVGRGRLVSVTTALRAFLRHLTSTGEGPAGLDAQVASPRIYRGERLPRTLEWDTVLAFLQSIDRTTPKGRRDYAVFLLIATYGLRASEVRALSLDSVNWRTREIRVPRPKVGTPLLLPLTDEVATALYDYLHNDRGATPDRHLFLRVEVPLGPLGRGAVGDAFRTWARRAGILLPTRGGPHTLRHALALRLLREGVALKSIGEILGHRSVESTGLYLRLDLNDLRDVALPLPATGQEEQVEP